MIDFFETLGILLAGQWIHILFKIAEMRRENSGYSIISYFKDFPYLLSGRFLTMIVLSWFKTQGFLDPILGLGPWTKLNLLIIGYGIDSFIRNIAQPRKKIRGD